MSGNRRAFKFSVGGDRFHRTGDYGGTFVRSYSVSILCRCKHPSHSLEQVFPVLIASGPSALVFWSFEPRSLLQNLLNFLQGCPRKPASSAEKYHWGQNDYLPNLYSRRIILSNSMCLILCLQKRTSRGTNTELLDKKLPYLNLF